MLSPDDFLNVIMKVTALPAETFRLKLLNAIRFADPGVSGAFFPGQSPQPYITYEKELYDGDCRELAVKYLSFSVSQYSNFGFNACIQNVNPDTINDWFDRNSNTVGQSMMVDYMRLPDQVGFYMADATGWATKIAAKIANADYFNYLLSYCDTASTMLPPKIILLMLSIMDNNGPDFLKVQQAWAGNPRWNEVADYNTYAWLTDQKISFQQGGPSYDTINQAVATACSASDVQYYTVTHGCFKGSCDEDYHTKTTYGENVAGWLNSSSGPALYGYRSAASFNNVTDVSVSKCCVSAGTPVLMADGSFKPIETIEEGDKIMSGDGVVSVCSSELYVKDQMTQLYSINDDEPFMSFEHAVMTQRGWCSLAPGLSMESTPHHPVKYLLKGDVVWKIKSISNGKIEYEKVVVEKINLKIISDGNGPAGYGLHFRGGHTSFHAHGYCCLLGYPEITAQYITSNILSDMSFPEQIKFRKQLKEISPLLSLALGEDVMTSVKKALKNPKQVAARGRHTNSNGFKKRVIRGAANMHLPKLKITLQGEHNAMPAPITEMTLMKGYLFINGSLATTHCDENNVYWMRKLDDGTEERGALRMLSNRLLGHGVVQYGDKTISFTAEYMQSFTTTIGPSKQRWFEFDMGSETDTTGNSHPVAQLSAPGNAELDTTLKKNSRVVLSILPKKQTPPALHADIEFDPAYCAFGGSKWIAAEIDMSTLGTSFSGILYDYDPSQPGYRGKGQVINGTSNEPASFDGIKKTLTEKMLNEPVNASFLSLSHKDTTIPDSLRPSLALSPAVEHKVEELFDIAPPLMDKLHGDSFGKLKSLMLREVNEQSSEWFSFFGEQVPGVGEGQALTQDEDNLRNDPAVKDFLYKQFSYGYLTQAFSKNPDPGLKAAFDAIRQQDPLMDSKLEFFWKGDGTTSFSKNSSYNTVMGKLMLSTYAQELESPFDFFMSSNPVDWAKQLYAYCIYKPTLYNLAFLTTPDSHTRLTHICNMLHSLDPLPRIKKASGKMVPYATSLYEQIMCIQLNESVKFAELTNQKDFSDFLTTFFTQYFTTIMKGDGWSDDTRSEAQQQLKQLMQRLETRDVNELVTDMGTFITDAVAIMVTMNTDGPLAEKINALFKDAAFRAKYPNLVEVYDLKGFTIIRVGLTLGVYMFGFYQSILTLLNWKDLTPEQKAIAVINIVNLGVSLINDTASLIAATRITAETADTSQLIDDANTLRNSFDSSTPLLIEYSDEEAVSADIELQDMSSPALSRASQGMNAILQQGQNADEAINAMWENITKWTGAAAKVMTVIALAGACVAAGFQIAHDFETGQPAVIKAFDILNEIANGIALFAEIFMLFTTAVSWIPIVGIVAAIVGLVISFIRMLLHESPPPTPQEQFVNQNSAPFITGLAIPGQDWIDKQKVFDQKSQTSLQFAFA